MKKFFDIETMEGRDAAQKAMLEMLLDAPLTSKSRSRRLQLLLGCVRRPFRKP